MATTTYAGTDGCQYIVEDISGGLQVTITAPSAPTRSMSISRGVLRPADSETVDLTNTKLLIIDGPISYLRQNMYSGCTALTEIRFDEHGVLEEIGSYAFSNCTALTTISIFPRSLTTIGMYAFRGCTSLTTVSFRDLTSIGEAAFSGCYNTEVYGLGNTHLTEIPNYVFSYCKFPHGIILPKGLTSIGEYCFPNAEAPMIQIPSTVTSISSTAFQSCWGVSVLIFMGAQPQLGSLCFDMGRSDHLVTATVYSPSNWAQSVLPSYTSGNWTTFSYSDMQFTGDDGLTYTLSDNNATLSISGTGPSTALTQGTLTMSYDPYVIFSIKGFSNLIINQGVTSLASSSFLNCTQLAQVSLPSTLTTIGSDSFANCTSLQTISIPANVTTIQDSVFRGCTALTSIAVDSNNGNYTSEDGVLFDKTKRYLVAYPIGKANTIYSVPNTVTQIFKDAFSGAVLTEVTFPDSLIIIQSYAFANCIGLTSLTFGPNVGTISAYAFSNCYNVTSITIEKEVMTTYESTAFRLGTPDHPVTCRVRSPNNWAEGVISEYPDEWTHMIFSASYYEAIDGLRYIYEDTILKITGTGPSAAEYCRVELTSGNHLVFLDVTNLIIEEGVTELQPVAFNNAQYLSSVTLPQSMVSIGAGAFSYCPLLRQLSLPNISEISSSLCAGCTSLETVNIPSSVTSVGTGAYIGCYGVTQLTFLGPAPTMTPSKNQFSLGISGHEAYAVVRSINNWAEEVGLEQYSNEYTHFTYEPLILIGSDGLTYDIKDGILHVKGNGAMTSLSNGTLTLQNGTSVRFTDITNAIIDSGITSINSNALKGLNLKIVSFRTSLVDNGNVLDGDYSNMIWGNKIQPRTYVYDNNIWYSLDEASFVLVFSPAGGIFTTQVVPKIKIAKTYTKQDNGKVIETSVQDTYRDLILYQTHDGINTYLWYYITDSVTKIDLLIKDLPTVLNQGISAPTGFDNIRSWEVQAPYHLFGFNTDSTPGYDADNYTAFGMTMERPTVETIKQSTAYPFWEPSRENKLRALVTAPGLGSLDFGNIQNINITYDSKLTVIPIVCYGYSGTFAMDLGVSKSISFSYIRVQPCGKITINGVTHDLPYNDTPNSNYWSNAKWIKKLREFTDRWQMRTNGCIFYLKRPNDPRLANGFTDEDPMSDFIEEIDGENCYITSTPIKYLEGHPYDFQGTLSLKMGTLYPKQTPVNTTQVVLRLDQNDSEDMRYYLQFPKGTAALVPPIPAAWSLFKVGTDTKYVSKLYVLGENNTKTYIESKTYFDPDTYDTIYGEVTLVDVDSQVLSVSSASQGSIIIRPFPDAISATITIYAIGGGGGGGGGMYIFETSQSVTKAVCAGGAGGASGCYQTEWYDVLGGDVSYTLSYVVGAGGGGGETGRINHSNSTNGSPGLETTVSINGTPVITALPGNGGARATTQYSPGIWTDRPAQYSPYSSYLGGDGGRGSEEPDGSRNGENGDGSSAGIGGERKDESDTAIYRCGGGGGGGSGVSFPIAEGYTIRGGYGRGVNINDAVNPNIVNGLGGGGGGGGSYASGNYTVGRFNGGKGGDGILHVIVRNGYIVRTT